MARGDSIVRQWYLLSKFGNPCGATLSELMGTVPGEYFRYLRTLRRNLEYLGFFLSISTERIDGPTRWRFIDGYRYLLSLSFSLSELMAQIFSRDLLRPLDGTEIHKSLEAAFNKARAILPPEGMNHVRQMQRYLSANLGQHKLYREHRETIELLNQAVAEKRSVQMRYYSGSRYTTRRREVDPYRLWYSGGAFYLVGYCHIRKEARLFAVDQIRSLAITEHTCQMPLGFDLDAYIQEALVVMRVDPIEVELLLCRKRAAWAGDPQWHPCQQVTQLKDGRMRLRLRVSDTPELLRRVLNFGAGVQVVSPPSLRNLVKEEAK